MVDFDGFDFDDDESTVVDKAGLSKIRSWEVKKVFRLFAWNGIGETERIWLVSKDEVDFRLIRFRLLRSELRLIHFLLLVIMEIDRTSAGCGLGVSGGYSDREEVWNVI